MLGNFLLACCKYRGIVIQLRRVILQIQHIQRFAAQLGFNAGPCVENPGEINVPLHGGEEVGFADIDQLHLFNISAFGVHNRLHCRFLSR
ncbi:hypothetical protein D3C75_1287920 [compost metagenome]